MMEFDRFEKALQTYFPSTNVECTSITNKLYITCDRLFTATLDFSRERSVMIEKIEGCTYKGIYLDKVKEMLDNQKYVLHALVMALIRSRKVLSLKRIYCKHRYFKEYIKNMFPTYSTNDEVNKLNSIKIDLLLNLESPKFAHLDMLGVIGSIDSKICLGVEYYPIWYIGTFSKKFECIEILKNFNPYIQNVYQILYTLDNNFHDVYQLTLMYTNILSSIKLSYSIIDTIIKDRFNGQMTGLLFKHIKSFKEFDQYIIDAYNISSLNIWDYLATLPNLSETYIDMHYKEFKPYFADIFKNPHLTVDFLKSHHRDILRTRSFPIVLLLNKNIDRTYLLKHIRRYKNAIIHRIALLNSGDEYLFNKYRRHLKWELLVENYTGREDVKLDDILFYGRNYLSDNHINMLKELHSNYIHNMFVVD